MRNQSDQKVGAFPTAAATAREHSAFHGFVVNGATTVEALAVFYGLRIPTAHRAKVIADYLGEHLSGYPLTGDRVPLGAIELVVLRKNGHAVELVGLDLCQPASMSRVRRGVRTSSDQALTMRAANSA